jgi:hypothetical protein
MDVTKGLGCIKLLGSLATLKDISYFVILHDLALSKRTRENGSDDHDMQ